MSNEVAVHSTMSKNLETVLLRGDLSVLGPADKIQYYQKVCESIGLNPLTKPFEYIKLNGKEVLYATRAATEQLRSIHKISLNITNREIINGVYVVTARAKDSHGREDESTGAVVVENLKGEALANAMMKSETKAKRRVTLSICGLALLDETEVASIPGVKLPPRDVEQDKASSEEQERVNLQSPTEPPKISTYQVTFGKFANKTFDEIPLDELQSYCQFLVKKADAEGKPIQGKVKEFLDLADDYISGAFEFASNNNTEEPAPF